MKAFSDKAIFPELRWMKYCCCFLVAGLAVTGFAQMPIFKRYYIADLPGLGWLAQFYVTHTLHYIAAVFLLAFACYIGLVYLLALRGESCLTWPARISITLLTAAIATGAFRVLKNLPDVVFSPGFTMFIDISHLVFAMALLGFGAGAMAARQPWLAKRRF